MFDQTPESQVQNPNNPNGYLLKKPSMISTHFVKIVTLLIISAVVFGGLISFFSYKNSTLPTNYEECLNAQGSVIQESYPASCVSKQGVLFTQLLDSFGNPISPGDDADQKNPLIPDEDLETSCVRAGCSNTLCLDPRTADEVNTTCEYLAEYACYADAVCERQSTGECGFTQSNQLTTCIERARNDTLDPFQPL